MTLPSYLDIGIDDVRKWRDIDLIKEEGPFRLHELIMYRLGWRVVKLDPPEIVHHAAPSLNMVMQYENHFALVRPNGTRRWSAPLEWQCWQQAPTWLFTSDLRDAHRLLRTVPKRQGWSVKREWDEEYKSVRYECAIAGGIGWARDWRQPMAITMAWLRWKDWLDGLNETHQNPSAALQDGQQRA